jgi:methyltransferase family protein
VLERTLAPSRVADIRAAIASGESRGLEITYAAPWNEGTQIAPRSVDVVLSHAVMQSVVDLDAVYRTLYAWLRPGGYMSHQIDFTSFRTSREWNGHWTYSETLWKVIVGKRPYLINREPHSTHVRVIHEHGFSIVCDMQRHSPESTIARSRLAPRWQGMTADDFTCSGAFIQARRSE